MRAVEDGVVVVELGFEVGVVVDVGEWHSC